MGNCVCVCKHSEEVEEKRGVSSHYYKNFLYALTPLPGSLVAVIAHYCLGRTVLFYRNSDLMVFDLDTKDWFWIKKKSNSKKPEEKSAIQQIVPNSFCSSVLVIREDKKIYMGNASFPLPLDIGAPFSFSYKRDLFLFWERSSVFVQLNLESKEETFLPSVSTNFVQKSVFILPVETVSGVSGLPGKKKKKVKFFLFGGTSYFEDGYACFVYDLQRQNWNLSRFLTSDVYYACQQDEETLYVFYVDKFYKWNLGTFRPTWDNYYCYPFIPPWHKDKKDKKDKKDLRTIRQMFFHDKENKKLYLFHDVSRTYWLELSTLAWTEEVLPKPLPKELKGCVDLHPDALEALRKVQF